MYKTATVISFSPTGNSLKSAVAMAEVIGETVEIVDITADVSPEGWKFGPEDFVIFSAPVYAGRIPKVARERLLCWKGENTPCIAVASFGNRDFDDALLEIADLAAEQGFVVKGGAAVVGRHTYGEIQMDRPNEEDLAECRAFAQKVLIQPENVVVSIPGNRPYKDGGNGGRFRPLTTEACVGCGVCETNCPVQAIAGDCVSVSDQCISCFRCIRNCPVGAKHMDVPAYREFAAMFTERLKERKENQYFL